MFPYKKNCFAEKLLKNLLNEIKQDLKENEQSEVNLSIFYAFFWLQSPNHKYISNLIAIYQMNAKYTIKFLMETLYKLLKKFISVGGATNHRAKTILVICEMIHICPKFLNTDDSNQACNNILELNLYEFKNKNLGPAKDLILEATGSVTNLAISSGAIFLGKTQTITIDEFFSYLENGSVMACTSSAFRCFLSYIHGFFISSTYLNAEKKQAFLEQKNRFVQLLYNTIYSFQAKNVSQYQKLIQEGISNADFLIDIILKWKSSIDEEHLNLIGALIPFSLSPIKSLPKILQALSDFKHKKESSLIFIAQGIYEIIFAIYLAFPESLLTKPNKEEKYKSKFLKIQLDQSKSKENLDRNSFLFNPLIKFVHDVRPKFEDYIFDPKKKKLTQQILRDFMPRYAALDFFIYKKETRSIEYILTQTEIEKISILTKFLTFVFSDYSRDQSKTFFNNTIFNIAYLLQNMLKEYVSKEYDKNIGDSLVHLINFFCDSYNNKMFWNFSRYSIISMNEHQSMLIKSFSYKKNEEYDLNIKDILSFEMSLGMQYFRNFLKDFSKLGFSISYILTIIAEMPLNPITPFLTFIRIFFTYENTWKSFLRTISLDIFTDFLMIIAESFQKEISLAIQKASPGITNIPYILNIFLNFVFQALNTYSGSNNQRFSVSNNKQHFLRKFMQIFSSSILILKCFSGNRFLDISNSYLKAIFEFFKISINSDELNAIKNDNDSNIIYAVHTIFSGWKNHILKQLTVDNYISNEDLNLLLSEYENSMDDSHAYIQEMFETSREVIALMTDFLCRRIHYLSQVPFSIANSSTIETIFFKLSCFYVFYSQNHDELFNCAFSNLNSLSYSQFFSILVEFIHTKINRFEFNNFYFWVNALDIISNVIDEKNLIANPNDGKNLTSKLFDDIEKIIHIFLNILFFGMFEKYFNVFIPVFIRIISNYYSLNHTGNKILLRTIVLSLMEIILKYIDDSSHKNAALFIIQKLPSILEFYEIDPFSSTVTTDLLKVDESEPSLEIHYVSNTSASEIINKTIWFILEAFQKISSTDFQENIIPTVQLCINIIIQNSSYIWPQYLKFAQNSTPLFHAIILESLSFLYGNKRKTTIQYMAFSTDNCNKRISYYNLKKTECDSTLNKTHSKKQKKKNVFKFLLKKKRSKLNASTYEANNDFFNPNSNISFIASKISSERSPFPNLINDSNEQKTTVSNEHPDQAKFYYSIFNRIVFNNTYKYKEKEHIFSLIFSNDLEILTNPPVKAAKFYEAVISWTMCY